MISLTNVTFTSNNITRIGGHAFIGSGLTAINLKDTKIITLPVSTSKEH